MTDYFSASGLPNIATEFPLGDAFFEQFSQLSRDQLRQQQEQRFVRIMQRAWQVPFYQRLWGNQGIEPGDIQGLDDLPKLPTYSKAELMASLEIAPPFGDFHGRDSYDVPPPMVFHTTSGTTGKPQPLFFGPRGREVQNLLLARIYRMQGLNADDVIHSVYGHGMINGGHYVRESVIHYTNALFMSAGTGIETRSLQQVQLMRDFGATVIVGFADYIKKLATVAAEQGIQPGRDIPVRMVCGHMGRESRESISASWGGAKVFDWYGVGDTGAIAAEGPDQDGMYVMEDAQFLEICDIDSGRAVTPGDTGDMVVTCLYKDDLYPIIRFNTHDVTAQIGGESSLGLKLNRIKGFLGRSDNMVKLRGINIFPQALGPLLEANNQFCGEFICVVERDTEGRDEMLVKAEVQSPEDLALKADLAELLKRSIGVEVNVELAPLGALAPMTGIDTRQKPIRLIDNRFD